MNMSDEKIDNKSYTKKEKENDKNNKINNFQQQGYSHDKNNKNNIPSEKDNKNNIKNLKNLKNLKNTNKDLTNKLIMQKNRALLNSAIDFDLLNNTQAQNTKNTSNYKHNKKTPNRTNNSNLSNSSRDNIISTTNMIVQTTTAHSGNIQNLKKKYLDFYKNNSKLKKNNTLPNLKKCSFSQKKLESFLDRVKEKQKLKELHINNIRCKSIENENSEMNVHPKMNKTSIILLRNKNRKPLYQEKPLNEEKNLEKNFQYFYAETLKDNQENPYLINTAIKKKDVKDINDKYNKFYEDKIKWKNNVEQKN